MCLSTIHPRAEQLPKIFVEKLLVQSLIEKELPIDFNIILIYTDNNITGSITGIITGSITNCTMKSFNRLIRNCR